MTRWLYLSPTAHWLAVHHGAYLWPEELHDGNLSVHSHFLDGPEPLCCDHIDLQPCVLGYEQIEVLCWCEVACGHMGVCLWLVTFHEFNEVNLGWVLNESKDERGWDGDQIWRSERHGEQSNLKSCTVKKVQYIQKSKQNEIKISMCV